MPIGKPGKHEKPQRPWRKRQKKTCPTCGGTGWKTTRIGMGSGAADFDTKKCRTCRGKGQVRE